ncbi:MAG: DUF6941 family protein [Akkermansiaceae bacterium]
MPENSAFMTRHLIVGFQGLTFPRPGVYSVDILVDSELIQRLPLRIIKVEENQPQG